MNKDTTTQYMNLLRRANRRGLEAIREFRSDMDKVAIRLIHEGLTHHMSAETIAQETGLTAKRVRAAMRVYGLEPKKGKAFLAHFASRALSENAALMGIQPEEMDLSSPLAYLPMGSVLRDRLEEEGRSRVTEVSGNPEDDERMFKALGWDRAHTMLCGDIYPKCQHRNPWIRVQA